MRISDWSSRVLFRSCTCRGAEPGEAVAGLRECRIDLDRRGDRAGAGEGERDMIVIRLGLRRGIGVEAVALMGAGTLPDRAPRLHPAVACDRAGDGAGEGIAIGRSYGRAPVRERVCQAG